MEIAGLLKKKKKMKKMTRNREIAYDRISRRVLESRTILLGIWIASYWPVSDLRLVLKSWPSVLAEFCGVLYADHVRFDQCHPYTSEKIISLK